MVTVREEVLWQPCNRRINGDHARGGSIVTMREEDQW